MIAFSSSPQLRRILALSSLALPVAAATAAELQPVAGSPAAPVQGGAEISVTVKGERQVVPQNTPIRLSLQKALHGNRVKPGQQFQLTVADDVVLPNHVVVVAKGAPASGHISNRHGNGYGARSSEFEFDLDSVKSVDGSLLPLNYHYKRQARNAKLLPLLVGPFNKGADARMHKGDLVTAFIGRPNVGQAR